MEQGKAEGHKGMEYSGVMFVAYLMRHIFECIGFILKRRKHTTNPKMKDLRYLVQKTQKLSLAAEDAQETPGVFTHAVPHPRRCAKVDD